MTCPTCGKWATLIAFEGRSPNRVLVWLCACERAFRSLERSGQVLTDDQEPRQQSRLSEVRR